MSKLTELIKELEQTANIFDFPRGCTSVTFAKKFLRRAYNLGRKDQEHLGKHFIKVKGKIK